MYACVGINDKVVWTAEVGFVSLVRPHHPQLSFPFHTHLTSQHIYQGEEGEGDHCICMIVILPVFRPTHLNARMTNIFGHSNLLVIKHLLQTKLPRVGKIEKGCFINIISSPAGENLIRDF